MTNAPELKTAEDSLSRGAQRRKSEENSSRSLTVFDIAAFFTLITSCISVALLALGAFRGLFALLLGLCAAGIFVLSFRALFIYQARTASVAAVLAVLALFSLFRFEPYRYEIGGQDQGAYVNISKHFDSSSTVYTIDKVRESVKDDPELLQYYDAHSHSSWVLWNKYRFHIPGIFIFDLDQSRYLFQFYHLHPLWMSIFAKVLGPENRSWSNVYFSFLSVCALALSLFYATKRKDIALLAAAVLAVHPLHAYFAKLPVSETPSLAFTALGLLYLVRFWDHRHCATYAVLFLGLSAASFFCLFLTRISGFLLMPFFVILYAAAHALNEEDSGRRLAVGLCHRGDHALYGLCALRVAVFRALFLAYLRGNVCQVSTFGNLESALDIGVCIAPNRHAHSRSPHGKEQPAVFIWVSQTDFSSAISSFQIGTCICPPANNRSLPILAKSGVYQSWLRVIYLRVAGYSGDTYAARKFRAAVSGAAPRPLPVAQYPFPFSPRCETRASLPVFLCEVSVQRFHAVRLDSWRFLCRKVRRALEASVVDAFSISCTWFLLLGVLLQPPNRQKRSEWQLSGS